VRGRTHPQVDLQRAWLLLLLRWWQQWPLLALVWLLC
jgi:hypothetical protein